ncbi:hypothetical protein CCP3SC15_150035 [Gammaproteobacteria bacterium]
MVVITKDGRFGVPPFCDSNFNVIVIDEQAKVAKEMKQGMMLPADLYLLGHLSEQLPDKPNVLEIGAFFGTSTCMIGLHVKEKNGKMTTIDPFTGNPTSLLNLEAIKLTPEQVEALLRENLRRHGLQDTVTIFKGRSDEFDIADNQYDLIFLDADHRYSYVMSDMERLWPSLREGGLFVGHDFDDPVYNDDFVEVDYALNKEGTRSVHHGVAKALYEFQIKYKQEVCKFADDEMIKGSAIWYIKKNDKVVRPKEVRINDKT